MKLSCLIAFVLSCSAVLAQPSPDSSIRVHPDKVTNHVSPWMYGSCIEDVNHEIYGGFYAQRIFGESFEEPPNVTPLSGWTRYGGDWAMHDGTLSVAADPGAKLVRNTPVVANGAVACDIRFNDASGENAGLIVRVSNPHVGPDRWTGYEVSLDIRKQALVLGRHREDWEPISTAATAIQAGEWYRLRVEMAGATLRIFVGNGNAPVIEYTDAAPIRAGQIGIRTWNSNASFRNLTVKGSKTVTDRLDGNGLVHDDGVSGMWDAVSTGSARGRYAWDSDRPYNTAHSQKITFAAGTGTVGIVNRGLNRWGIAIRSGQPMTGRLYTRGSDFRGRITVALQSADGTRTYATQSFGAGGSNWIRRNFHLAPNATDPKARFAVWIDRPGTVSIDEVYLSPSGKALFRGLPLRADIGDKLVQEGLTFMRYGGTMVNAAAYRWKSMIGDRDKRPQYRGWWYAPGTNGFGIEDFLQFCEKARIEPAFAINIEETPQDAADLVEYLNGPASSAWGAKRAANGHPAPYNVRYIEIGNEEAISGNRAEYTHYLERFQLLYAAMRPRDPHVKYVIAAWWRPEEPLCRQIAQALNGRAALWDVHIDADNLRDAESADQRLTQMQALFGEWIPGSTMRACVFEENGNRHDLQRALGHARLLNVTQRHGDFVQMDCPANCLQPLGQNDNGWDQGQVFFLPDRVWTMPPYYAQQMAARNHLPLCVTAEVESPNNDLDVTAATSADARTMVLKVVNSGSDPHTAAIALGEFAATRHADVWTLTGSLPDVNTPETPERVRSNSSSIAIPNTDFEYTFPPHAYVVIRLQRAV